MGTNGFRGWPPDALAFSDEIRDEFGPLHIFRPFRDTRFAKDKTPYKTHLGAVTEGEGGSSRRPNRRVLP